MSQARGAVAAVALHATLVQDANQLCAQANSASYSQWHEFTRFSGSSPDVTLTFVFWPQNLISTSMNPDTFVVKTGWNSPHWFWGTLFTVFGTHRLAHGRTRPKTVCLSAARYQ